MTSNDTPCDPHPYVGMWVTANGFIRQELLPNGRYDEARGNRQSAYTGSYTVTGTWNGVTAAPLSVALSG